MSRFFFTKLAADNIRKNKKTYFPYLLTCIITIAVFYIFRSLTYNPGLRDIKGSNAMSTILSLGSAIIGIFAVIFLFYTNSFLLKRRKKEFAVFNILGMEKRHIIRTLALETLYSAIISIGLGLLIGIAFDKLMFLVVVRIVQIEITLGFFISAQVIISTITLFGVVFLLILLNSIRQVQTADPVRLLQESSAGEREPRSRWILAIAGLLCIAAGYYIAITTENPLDAFNIFFIAVLLIIVGTYMTFTAFSVVLLKTMRKNKRFYYQPKHFISVSGMLYRMKQNAVGLANICILSTMVIVIMSATSSMMVGMEDIVQSRFGNDFLIRSYDGMDENMTLLIDEIRALREERGINASEEYSYTSFGTAAIGNEDTFSSEDDAVYSSIGVESYTQLFFIPLDDFNAASGEAKELDDNEILIYSLNNDYTYSTINIFDRQYVVKESLSDFFCNDFANTTTAVNTLFIVVKDRAELDVINQVVADHLGYSERILGYYVFDTDADEETQSELYEDIDRFIDDGELNAYAESRAYSKYSIYMMYGGLFFIGIFLGALFMMAAVLIIYYKQISEGYDDKERFEIMQKVGMSTGQVKSAIRSQVLTVFFLPLIASGCHVTATFPMILRIMALLNMPNTTLYIICAFATFAAFSVLYVIIYMITSGNYYSIVKR